MNLTSPVAGAACTGLTSPTYTLTSDVSSNTDEKSWLVTALGGTQDGVMAHSLMVPFRIIYKRPSKIKNLVTMAANFVGLATNAPRNTHTLRIEKGCKINTTGAYGPNSVKIEFNHCAGSAYFDNQQMRAMLSCALGVIAQIGANALASDAESGSF